MNMKNLATFLQVAEWNSFTKAAEKLGYTQSTVSFQIKQLETELGVALIDRIGHTISITQDGERLVDTAYGVQNLLNDYMATIGTKDEVAGHVRIAMANSLCDQMMEYMVPALHQIHPGITLETIQSETNEMLNLLNHNEADLVCTLDTHIYDKTYKLLVEKPIGLHFVISPKSHLAGQKVLLKDLAQEAFLLTEKNMSYRKLLDEHFAQESIEIQPLFVSGNVDLLCRLVIANQGISFLPDFATQKYIKTGELVILNVEDCQLDVWFQLFHHRNKWVTKAMNRVIEQFLIAVERL